MQYFLLTCPLRYAVYSLHVSQTQNNSQQQRSYLGITIIQHQPHKLSTHVSCVSHHAQWEIDSVDAISANHKSQRPRQQSKRSTSPSSICFYHTCFGPDARKCQENCKFSSLLSRKVVAKSSGNA